MEVLSRAWRTDLALLARGGSEVEHHGTYAVVRTPGNPGFRGGNYILLRRVPPRRQLAAWVDVHERALPEVTHRAFGFDDTEPERSLLRAFTDHGYDVTLDRVLTADAVHLPSDHHALRDVRHLRSDAEWQQRAELAMAAAEEQHTPAFASYVQRAIAAERALAADGDGAWFGAFVHGRMVSGLGVVSAGEGLARFQHVETHPEHRRSGLATDLVSAAGRYALEMLGVRTLVVVADPTYHALRAYTETGFVESEVQPRAVLTGAGVPHPSPAGGATA